MKRLFYFAGGIAALIAFLCFAQPHASAQPSSKNGDASAAQAQVEQQQRIDRYNQLVKEQEERQNRMESLIQRQEQLMTKQEAAFTRFEKILDTWEVQQKQYQKYLDSLKK